MHALQTYLDRHFEARRKLGGDACPGEEICAVTGPLRDKSRPIETICAACDKLPTKPGNIPNQIAPLVVAAYRMEALFEGGAAAPYPEVFSPLEWEAFLTLKYARSKDEEKRMPPQKQAGTRASEEARLKRRLARG